MHNTALIFFQRTNKQPPFSQNFPLYTVKNENTQNNSQVIFMNSQSNKFIVMTKVKTDNISISLTLNYY